MIGIYKITSPSGKIYIGSSINLRVRFSTYKRLSCKAQSKLYNSFVKHGVDNHILEIIEECSIEQLYKRERYFGLLYGVLSERGLNLKLPGDGEQKVLISEEMRDIMKTAIKTKFKKGHIESIETRNKRSEALKGRKMQYRDSSKEVSIVKSLNASVLIIDLETGIFYDSIKEAAIAKDINYHTLRGRINRSKSKGCMIVHAQEQTKYIRKEDK